MSLNKNCIVHAYVEHFDEENALALSDGCDLLIDACDNLYTRYLLDETSQKLRIPYLYGAVSHFQGQVSLFNYNGSGSYRDLFPTYDYNEDKKDVPILGSVTGIIGSILATEAVKVLLQIGSPLSGKILLINTLNFDFNILKLS